MKIRLTIELDLPDGYSKWPDAELRQLVFDSYVNYNTVAHMEDAIARFGKTDDAVSRMAYNHHKEWSAISGSAVFAIEKI